MASIKVKVALDSSTIDEMFLALDEMRHALERAKVIAVNNTKETLQQKAKRRALEQRAEIAISTIGKIVDAKSYDEQLTIAAQAKEAIEQISDKPTMVEWVESIFRDRTREGPSVYINGEAWLPRSSQYDYSQDRGGLTMLKLEIENSRGETMTLRLGITRDPTPFMKPES